MKFFAPPAYSFSSRPTKNAETTSMITPGPGTYEVRSDLEHITPGVLISSSPKPNPNPFNPVPGPGSYEIPHFVSPKRKSSSKHLNSKGRDGNALKPLKERVGRTTSTDYPGPGTYNPSRKERGPNIFVGNKTYCFEKSDVAIPGPGSYEPKPIPKGPEVMMRTAQRSTITGFFENSGPGPAAYSTRAQIDSPQYGFGTAPKMVKSSSSSNIPGPGKYSIGGGMEKAGFSIAGKPKEGRDGEGSPGPGAYSPRLPARNKGVGFGTGGRSNFMKAEDSPGPGEYDPSHPYETSTRKVTLNTSPRRPLECCSSSPGPAAYTLPSTIDSGAKISLTARRVDHMSSILHKIVPGPGAYLPVFSAVESHQPQASLGSSQRTDIALTTLSPGPAYDVRRKPDPPFWGIRKEGLKLNRPSDDVGPGSYDIPASFPEAAKYSQKAINK